MRPVINASLSDQVYESLKRSIIERQLAPNSKLDINALSQNLGVSRMPVMDALTRLEHEGLVTRRNRVGTFVTGFDRRMVEEVFDARDMIEQWAAAPAIARIQPGDVGDLRAMLGKAEALLNAADDQSFDYMAYNAYDENFHQRLIMLCDNSRVIEMYAALHSHIQIARAYARHGLQRSKEGRAEHTAILQAYAEKDVERARAAQHEHLERSRRGVLALLEEHGVL